MTKVPVAKDGRVTGHRKHTYDAWNRLVKVETDASSPLTIATMEYDGLGRRIYKKVENSDPHNHTYHFYYDGQRIVETRDGSGYISMQKVWGPTYVDEAVQVGINDDPYDSSEDD